MEETSENKYLIRCSNLPVPLLDKSTAKEHFSKFGRLVSIHLRIKTKGCTVEYADKYGSQNALENSGTYEGKKFGVARGGKTTKKSIKKGLWTPNAEVEAELEAMSGVGIYKLQTASKVKEKKKKSTKENSELLKIIKQPAVTIEDKFKILDARDKLIRLRMNKSADFGSKHTVGTCPDMCPEKERLMREVQHQVALYEQEPQTKTLNPILAVKQYSRSSADQESPLPHELRSVEVLQMTMGYLLHRIIPLGDLPDVNLAEWYHFVWDRTRGIRKDITQQELCCKGSVELVEQCARFHIHCSARLVAEDPSVFDQKINSENLTKCLQSLKYMYHDLGCKSEKCADEAEFRGYIILLNLNDGKFMWEVQQLREDIQKSEPVQFALKVYSALDKNNYVKFFNLVKSTTYLNACILLRYFIQVRVRALQTILKSFSPRGITQFPLEELKEILAFEDLAATKEFVEYYGLYVNDSGNYINLDRNSFQIPELPYALDRAIHLVESKRKLGINEIICGGNLPERVFESHKPHSSFDEFGVLNLKDYLDDDDLNVTHEDESNSKRFDSRSNSPFDAVDSSISLIKKPSKDIFTKIQPIPSEPTSDSFFQPKAIVQEPPKTVFEIHQHPQNQNIDNSFASSSQKETPIFFGQTSIFGKPVTEASGGFSFKLSPKPEFKFQETSKQKQTAEIEEEKKRIVEMQRQEEEDLRKKLLEEKLMREANERRRLKEEEEKRSRELEKRKIERLKLIELNRIRVEEERKREKELELKRIEEEKRRLEEDKKTKEIRRDVGRLMKDLLIRVDEKNKNDRLEEIRSKLRNEKMKKFVFKWRSNVMKLKRKRKAIDDWPIWVDSKTHQEEARDLRQNHQKFVLMDMKRYKTGNPNDTDLPKKFIVKPIGFNHIILNLLKNNPIKNHIFWKIDICFPSINESKTNLRKIKENLIETLGFDSETNRVMKTENFMGKKITICIQQIDKYHINESTDGFLFINDFFTKEFCLNIKKTIRNHHNIIAIPLGIILSNNDYKEDELDELIEDGLISDYKVFNEEFITNVNLETIEKTLRYLASNTPEEPPLELDDFKSFLSKYLVGETWERINSFGEENRPFGICLTHPENVFYLYRKLLEKLKGFILNPDLHEYKDFPKVFSDRRPELISLPCDRKYFPDFWKNESYNRKLRRVFDQFKLPENIHLKSPPKDVTELESSLYELTEKFGCPDKTAFKILSLITSKLEAIGSFEAIKYMMWTDVIKTLVSEKLQSLDFTLREPFLSKSIFERLFVVYDSEELQKFKSDYWFYTDRFIRENMNLTEILIEDESEEDIEIGDFEEDGFDLKKAFDEAQNRDVAESEAFEKTRSEVGEMRVMLDDLEESMELQKKISMRIRETLANALKN